MQRRDFVASVGVGAAALLSGTARAQGRPTARALVFDAMGELRPEYDVALLREIRASGLDAITVTLCDPKPIGAEAVQLAVDGVAEYDAFIARHPTLLLKATKVADIDRARSSGRIAVFYLFQNTAQFGTNLDRVTLFARLGVRSSQLTYNDINDAGAGCRSPGGRLTPFGRELIAKMNAERMLLDLSHVHMDTMADAIAASRTSAVISHTACATVHAHVRNTTDANLRALAERGGVVGICQIRPFITEQRRANLDRYVAHVLHAVRVAGVEHVAIGSDRDHRRIDLTPEYIAQLKREEGAQFVEADLPLFLEALNGPRRMEVVRDALAKKLPARDVDRILGGNLRRLYAEVIG
ncbi:MAG: dipeptidase [Gemmatimonadaceae bacterium]|nr:dipeptidase [Gemmatimonadaceae bacterium]